MIEYFNLNFSLLKHEMFTLSELENMLGYEREIYTNLLIADLKKRNENWQRVVERPPSVASTVSNI